MVSDTLNISDKTAIKYPKSIAFIISNEFCERFNYYGMRTILVLYLTKKLGYDDDTSTVLFHVFTCMVYFFPLIGAILADSWLGRFRTIFYLSLVYCAGSILVALGAIPTLQFPVKITTIIGLILIAVGTGGIKPCVSAFGGEQFKIPEQAKQLATFFSLFYFAINAGSMISTSVTPILRQDVHCFGDQDCFSLAFGVPGVLMIVSIIIFILGKRLYVIKKPSGNMIVQVSKCVTEALRKRSQEKNSAPREHWLDYAEKKYGKKLVEDTKALLKVLVLYLPLPVFWALFDQQGSRWTFQATRMIGTVGSFTIKPDQIQVINPLLILAFIPLFDYAVYPILAKCGLRRPLQKLTTGGLLAAIAFVLSAVVELQLEKTDPVLPGPNESQLRIINGMSCDYHFNADLPDHRNFSVNSLSIFEEKHVQVDDIKLFIVNASSNNPEKCPQIQSEIKLSPKKAMSYFLTHRNDIMIMREFEDNPKKPKKEYSSVRLLSSLSNIDEVIHLKGSSIDKDLYANDTELIEVTPGEYEVLLEDKPIAKTNVELGGVYTFIVLQESDGSIKFSSLIITEPNSMHMFWQLPQYVVITAAEVMFSVTGLEFSFTQAPSSMKSVLQACWLLTVAFGNLIVVLIAEFRLFQSQAAEFFLFAFLMVLDMAVFIVLAIRYTYVQTESDEDNENALGELATSTSDIHDKPSSPKGHTNEAYIGD